MLDVLIVGAGPAGAVAATLLARAGARVRIVDRAVFPRDKLCGDTVNPGAVQLLKRLGLASSLEACSVPFKAMRVSGSVADRSVMIEGRFPGGLTARALLRKHFDWMLLQDAMAAGAQFEPGVAVRHALVDDGRVSGVKLGGGCDLRARVTIAADGRRSTIAFGLGLAAHPRQPRRWAVGAYVEDAARKADADLVGEMHVRAGHYIGIAPVPDGLTNVCVVTPWAAGDGALGDPTVFIRRTLAGDRLLRDRFAGARFVTAPVVLGPLAIDAREGSFDGLLLAGDATGFIDPMTGDGLRLAMRGAELAAAAALDALAHGWTGVHARLAHERRREFAGKWRFNRAVRSLGSSPSAVAAAVAGVRIAPSILRHAMVYAGDCAR